MDDRQSYGEVPGTAAYKMREQDAVPDELEILPDGGKSKRKPKGPGEMSTSSPNSPIPKTVVEKVDPSSPSHGDVPGTAAHSKRQADAVPDIVRPISVGRGISSLEQSNEAWRLDESSIPNTVITKVDSLPSHGEVPGTEAFDKRKGDAQPDIVEKKSDSRSESWSSLSHTVQRTID